VDRVLAVYETARQEAVAEPKVLEDALVAATKLPAPVIAKQLERTDLASSRIGKTQEDTIREAGLALQKAGVLAADVDVAKVTDDLVDDRFTLASQ